MSSLGSTLGTVKIGDFVLGQKVAKVASIASSAKTPDVFTVRNEKTDVLSVNTIERVNEKTANFLTVSFTTNVQINSIESFRKTYFDGLFEPNVHYNPDVDTNRSLKINAHNPLVLERNELDVKASFIDESIMLNSIIRDNAASKISTGFIHNVESISSSNQSISLTANPGSVLREYVDGRTKLGEFSIGSFKIGNERGGNRNVLEPFTSTFRIAPANVATRSVIEVSDTFSRRLVPALLSKPSSIFVTEGVARQINRGLINIKPATVSIVLARIFDGDVVSQLANQIFAFRKLTEWAIGQRQLGTTIEETREWSALELVYQFEKFDFQQNNPNFFTVEEATNDLKARSEKVSVRELIDGGFTGVDLSGEGNTLNIRAPFDREKVRPVNEWFVNSVDVENISRDTNTFEVELELVPEKSKEFDNEYGTFESPKIQSPSASQWTFEFEFGTIATRRVTVETTESSSGTLDVQELELVLQPEQVRIFEENVSHLNLVYERSVPDGFDIVDDTSSDERNTVQISPPANVDESVAEGKYSFVSWETEWRAGTFVCTWEVATDEN